MYVLLNFIVMMDFDCGATGATEDTVKAIQKLYGTSGHHHARF